VKRLIEEFKVDLHARNNDGLTPIICAVQQGHVDVVRYVLEVDSSCALDQNKAGDTPLHYAVAADSSVAMVSLLLEFGADAEIPNSDNRSPMEEAILDKKTLLSNIFRISVPQLRELRSPAVVDAASLDTRREARKRIIASAVAACTEGSFLPGNDPTVENLLRAAPPKRRAPTPFSSSRAGIRTRTTVERLKEELKAEKDMDAHSEPIPAAAVMKTPRSRIIQPTKNPLGPF
jgi:ankyrin repeat protein